MVLLVKIIGSASVPVTTTNLGDTLDFFFFNKQEIHLIKCLVLLTVYEYRKRWDLSSISTHQQNYASNLIP